MILNPCPERVIFGETAVSHPSVPEKRPNPGEDPAPGEAEGVGLGLTRNAVVNNFNH